jgi:hypothetical protein
MRYAMFAGTTFAVNGATLVSVVDSPGATVIVASQVGNAFVGGTPGAPGTVAAAFGGGDLGFGLSLDPRGFAGL